jgi:single-stranded-DNA-specific exonuclease
MQKRWNILNVDESKVEALFSSLKINRTLCRILVQRGLDNFELSKKFFRPQIADLHSPWLMKDMDKAVARILLAFEQREKILVFGDYDVDGTTAVACLYQFLKLIYPSVEFYIPHRYREGYGVSKAGIDYAKEQGITLIS